MLVTWRYFIGVWWCFIKHRIRKIIQHRHMTRLWKFYFVGVRLTFRLPSFPYVSFLRGNCVEQSDLLPKRRSQNFQWVLFHHHNRFDFVVNSFFFVAFALMNTADNRRLNKLWRQRESIKAGNWQKKESCSLVQAHWATLTQFDAGAQCSDCFPQKNFLDEIMMNAVENRRPNKTQSSVMRNKLKVRKLTIL